MSDGLYLDILDDKRREILQCFSELKDEYYLAGGTGLSLQIGHRDSIDFDFFHSGSFSTLELNLRLAKILSGREIMVIQEEKDTLTVMIDRSVKASFFGYPYKLVRPLVSNELISLASVEDIGCMKLAAIISRSLQKDYVDLYFIIRRFSLPLLLDMASEKFPNFNTALALKSLTYFDDITPEPILYKRDSDVTFDTVRLFLAQQAKKTIDTRFV
jgi:hypothetical protein